MRVLIVSNGYTMRSTVNAADAPAIHMSAFLGFFSDIGGGWLCRVVATRKNHRGQLRVLSVWALDVVESSKYSEKATKEKEILVRE